MFFIALHSFLCRLYAACCLLLVIATRLLTTRCLPLVITACLPLEEAAGCPAAFPACCLLPCLLPCFASGVGCSGCVFIAFWRPRPCLGAVPSWLPALRVPVQVLPLLCCPCACLLLASGISCPDAFPCPACYPRLLCLLIVCTYVLGAPPKTRPAITQPAMFSYMYKNMAENTLKTHRQAQTHQMQWHSYLNHHQPPAAQATAATSTPKPPVTTTALATTRNPTQQPQQQQ